MKSKLTYLLRFIITLLAAFIVMKVVFMLYNAPISILKATDIAAVIWNGLPLDISTCCYLAILPWLMCLVAIWIKGKWLHKALKTYIWVIAPLLAFILVTDCALYEFWQFKLDATILNYIDTPQGVVASVSAVFLIIALLGTILLTVIIAWALIKATDIKWRTDKHRIRATIALVIFAGAMFLAIRGGIGRSTMNVGKVYFSSNQFLNHSAVNPAFSLISSAFKVKDFDRLYRFYNEKQCDSLFTNLKYSTKSIGNIRLLENDRPNIVLVIMEGFGATFIEKLGGEKNITPQFNKLIDEGVLFSKCYANSFRTDRGIVSTLSGYPAFPDFSVMKIPEKSRTLPSIAHTLGQHGYSTSFLYGGDIDFTNTNSFLLSTGYQQTWGDTHFPIKVRRTHSWGVTDRIVLDTLYRHIIHQPSERNFFITCLTLSSHEDWNVLYNRIPNNKVANSMAYLDDCIGLLVRRLKKTHYWDNLLLIFIPDHGIQYPRGLTEADIRRYHIPMLWVGGAIKQPRNIDVLCNQSDFAATLLGQLHLSHNDFSFSRDITSKDYTYPCAFHTFGGGVAFIDSTGASVEDLHSHHLISNQGDKQSTSQRRNNAHVILQKAINDFSDR